MEGRPGSPLAGPWSSVSGGKRDEELILPINSSLSVTLHQEQVSVLTRMPSAYHKLSNRRRLFA